MFLAWNEIKRNKLRFTLIIGVLMLVAYLVFFLSGLATGLQTLNREGVDKWKADAIILTDEADRSLFQSVMTMDKKDEIQAKEIAPLGQLSAIASDGEEKKNISLFGIDPDSFLMPELTEGEAFQKKYEVIISDQLKEQDFKIGDTFKLSASEIELKVVGFTDEARFNGAPIIYSDFDTFRDLKFGENNEAMRTALNGFVLRTENDADLSKVTQDSSLEVIPIENFIEKLPGYSEQNLTLTLMIYFLLVISAVVIAIFLYVLTVQKTNIFGVMKAQGISSSYLAKSVIAQTFILSFVGVIIGLGLTLLTGLFLPEAVPVTFNIPIMLIYGAIFVIVAIIGSLFSVRTIVKIDPLQAIGGA